MSDQIDGAGSEPPLPSTGVGDGRRPALGLQSRAVVGAHRGLRVMRQRLLEEVASRTMALVGDGPTLVAVDGVDGAGKTFLADELSVVLEDQNVATVRASVDGFHNPQHIRYRRGRTSPEGFYLDSYDYGSLCSLLLDPLRPGGSRRVIRAVYDVRQEQRVQPWPEVVNEDAVLILDGIFLHRPELRGYWDLSVFLDVPFEISIPRCAARGGGHPDPTAPSNRRYVNGQKLYLRTCEPRRHATFVIDNAELAKPRICDRN